MENEETDFEFLKKLSSKLWHIPAKYGTDGYHIDRLIEISNRYEDICNLVEDCIESETEFETSWDCDAKAFLFAAGKNR